MTIRLHLLALAAVTAAIPALAQSTASTSASVTAAIVAPLAISKTTDLVFGKIVPGASAGTVTISPGGTATPSGVTLLPGITRSAAVFNITGNGGDSYYIDIPASGSLASGAHTMSLTFQGQLDGTGSASLSGTINPTMPVAGTSQLTLGGTLSVADGSTQTAGSYSGTVSVTVRYQ